jgi:hypothetical protein
MNFLRSLVAVVAIFASCSAFSSNQWYFGVTQGFYSVGEGDHWNGEIDIGQAGLQIGKFITEDLSVEGGYAFNSDREDFFIGSLTALFWKGDSTQKYQPYLLLGTNVYNFDDEEGLPIKHRHTQVAFGAGFGSKISKQYQVRADVRLMARNEENEDDFAFQFSINRLFD